MNEWSVYIAIWVVCGFAAMLIAKARGRPERGPSWFGAGLVLGPVGVLLALFLPNKPKEPVSFAPSASPEPSVKPAGYCPSCGVPRLPDARFCAACGRALA